MIPDQREKNAGCQPAESGPDSRGWVTTRALSHLGPIGGCWFRGKMPAFDLRGWSFQVGGCVVHGSEIAEITQEVIRDRCRGANESVGINGCCKD